MRALLLVLLVVPGLAGCLEARVGPDPWPGAAHVDGPPGPPVPLLPLNVTREGEFAGEAWNLEAYRYCLGTDAPGLRLSYRGDNVLRYDIAPLQRERAPPWYADRIGQPARPEDFQPGQAAQVSWRSELTDKVLRFLILRLNRTPDIAPGLDAAEVRGLLWRGFAAFAAYDTHVCCLLTWHSERMARTTGDGQSWDHLFDPCHLVNFDPYLLVPAQVPPVLGYRGSERPPPAPP